MRPDSSISEDFAGSDATKTPTATPSKPNAYTNPDEYLNWLKVTQGMSQQDAATTLRWQAQADKIEADKASAAQAAKDAADAEKERLRLKAVEDARLAQERQSLIAGPPIATTETTSGNISNAGEGVPTTPEEEITTAVDTPEETITLPERVSVFQTLTSRFNQYGLGTLVNKIKELVIDGATEATITLALQETPEYKARFKANEARLAKGLAVLSPAEYITVEDSYRQVLRAYGLKSFDNDNYVSQFIANDVSPTELNNRVVTAVQRVQMADPAVSKTLRDYYNIGNTDLVSYMLSPDTQLPEIERKVNAAEIGAAARAQGLNTGVDVAEALAAKGVTAEAAQKGYATIAGILPTAQKLSDIYGTRLDKYGQAEAEQEAFNSLASAQRKREKLAQQEIATFGGSSGIGNQSLKSSSRGQI
jgi:hypothetical protein